MSKGNYAKKVKMRAGHRAFVEKTIQDVDKLLLADFQSSPSERDRLEGFKETLVSKKDLISKLDDAILEATTDDQKINEEIFEASEFSQTISRAVVKINRILEKIASDATTPQTAQASGNSSTGTSPMTLGLSTKQMAKLPRLTLPKFAGDSLSWQSFWDSFEAAIHNNESISKVEKFNYLKGQLEGPAATAISGFALTADNYDAVVTLLKERFADNQVIIQRHMDALLSLEKVPNVEDIRKVRKLYDTVETHLRSLENLGVSAESYGSLLVPIIMSRIPEDLTLLLSRKIDKNNWNVNEVLAELKKELEARERCTMISTKQSNPSGKSSGATKSKNHPLSASTLYSGRDNQTRSKAYCVFCEGDHVSVKCGLVTDVAARRRILRRKGKCFICLKSGHIMRDCPSKQRCFKCKGVHHTALCEPVSKREEKPAQLEHAQTSGATPQVQRQVDSSNLCVDSQTSVLLQTAQGFVGQPNNFGTKVKVRMLFDSGSQRSYVTCRLQQALQLPVIGNDNLLIKAFGEESPRLRSCDLVQMAITSTDGMELYINAYSVPTICIPLSNQAVGVAVHDYPHLQGLELADNNADVCEVEIEVLIGADYYWNFFTGEVRRGSLPGPVALSSKLGWVLSGPLLSSYQESHGYSANICSTHVLKIESVSTTLKEHDGVDKQLSMFWDLESLGIQKNEISVEERFIDEVSFDGTRYVAKLPFKENHPCLPDNYSICEKRLSNLLSRLQSTPEILQEYDRIIKEQHKEGIVESFEEGNVCSVGSSHYLPHREVVRMDKDTTKLRIVYDASAKKDGPSLNDCLHPGPPLSPLIFDIMVRFRMNKVAVTADIERAFLNIAIAPEHRDFLRFLWVDDPFSISPRMVRMRFARVVFGVTSSPFILNATIRHHINQYTSSDPEFVQDVLNSLYVDDYASGSQTVTSTIEICKKIKSRLADGGFNLRKWKSNSETVVETLSKSPEKKESSLPPASITEEDRGYAQSSFSKTSEPVPKVLGQRWNHQVDELEFEFSKVITIAESDVITKRVILSASSRFYDPVGLVAPIVLPFKLIFQEVCQKHVSWDDPVNEMVSDKWKTLTRKLKEAGTVSVKRFCCCSEENAKSTQLHVFADASTSAYGSCVYLRCEHESSICCNLIASKTRVAPLEKQTIPRLELLGCLVAARLSQSVMKALQSTSTGSFIDRTVYWCDSTVALSWVRNVKNYKQFVQNRVTEIRNSTTVEAWRYCPTKDNPADIASRGVFATALAEEGKWWHGPAFLRETEDKWPVQPESMSSNGDLENREVKATVAVVKSMKNLGLEEVMEPTLYSSELFLKRVTAYVLRFIHNLKGRVTKTELRSGELHASEINEAEQIWIMELQKNITEGDKFKQVKSSLDLFEDEHGLLRCRGRLQNAPLPYESKYPILLPADHHYTKLVIERCHQEVMHNGTQETLAQLRSRYWVVKGRQVVKRTLSKCRICRRLEGRAYGVPEPAPLPNFRLSDDFAFSNIGVDHAGPMYVKDIYSKSTEMHKVYIVLYTCASSRAVHLDLAPDVSSRSFIRSFERFIGRRGVPSFVLSDNGKAFKSQELKSFLASKGIKWRYNVERSPWWGGFFERMVKSTKRCLKKSLRTARLTYEELLTLLIKVEGVLNSRPLTYLCEDGGECLTPSQLVIGRRLLSRPSMSNEVMVTSEDAETVSRRQKYLQTLLRQFWKKWRRDYLTQLREQHRSRKVKGPEINVGDVVSVYEDKVKRLNWNIARVERLLSGKDGKVRAAVVRYIGGSGYPVELNRPIQRLFPIELQTKNTTDFPIRFVEHAQDEN